MRDDELNWRAPWKFPAGGPDRGRRVGAFGGHTRPSNRPWSREAIWFALRRILPLWLACLGGSATMSAEPIGLGDEKLLRILDRQERLFSALETEQDSARLANYENSVQLLVQDYEGQINNFPTHLHSHVLYGKFLRRIGERERAQEMFLRANAIDPKVAVVKQQLGNYFAEDGEHARALLYYLAALELAPKEAVYHYTLGELLHTFRDSFLRDGAYDRPTLDRLMRQAFAEAALLAPDQIDLQLRYGECFYDLAGSDWPAALSHWESLENRLPEGPTRQAVRLHRARVLAEMGRNEESRQLVLTIEAPYLAATRERLLARLENREPVLPAMAQAGPVTVPGRPTRPGTANPSPPSQPPPSASGAAARTP